MGSRRELAVAVNTTATLCWCGAQLMRELVLPPTPVTCVAADSSLQGLSGEYADALPRQEASGTVDRGLGAISTG